MCIASAVTALPANVLVMRLRHMTFPYCLLLLLPLVLLFTTAQPAAAVSVCTTDTAGANDEPGQKDLTKLCSDDAGLPSTLAVDWQWDQAGWAGNNTGNACSLIDTDGDGNANYSLCTIISGIPGSLQGQQLYQCNDSRPEKCPGASPIASSSVCTAEVQGTLALPADPFPTGNDYPRDTVGSCNVNLLDLGSGAAKLLDVCAYPSLQPDLDPADCVNYRDNSGRLEVRKVLRPATNPGRFNLLIDNSIKASAVGDGGTTGEQIVDAGQHSVGEISASNTSLDDYNTSIECRDNNGAGAVIAAQANNSPLTVTVPDGGDVVCTITNVRQTGTINVTKVVSWNGIPPGQNQTFEICIYGASYPAGSCQTTDFDGGLLTWADVESGFYDIVETDPGDAWSIVVDSSPVSVPGNGSASVTVTNTHKRGSLEITKFVNWNGATPDTAKTFAICISGPSFPTPDCQTADYDGATLLWTDLIPGSYDIAETDPGSQWWVTIADTPVVIPPDGITARASVANTYKSGGLTVTKIVDWNGVTPDPNQTFTICITGPSYPNSNCQTAGYLGGALNWFELIPGSYTVSETDAGSLWTTVVNGSPVTIDIESGDAVASVVNTRKLGGLQVTKTVNWNGAPTDFSRFFQICITGPSFPNGDCRTAPSGGGVLNWNNLIPGAYTVSENDPGNLWTVQVPQAPVTVPGDGSSAAANVTNIRKHGTLQVNKTVDWNGATPDTGRSFEICIHGPSYPGGTCQTVGYSGGPVYWYDLIPGGYVVSETEPGVEWTTTVADSRAIIAGDGGTTVASVTNTHKRGGLTVIKVVQWNGVAPDTTQTFRLCITGPSYPGSDCQSTDFDGGALVWDNLVPGDYSISEVALGSEWAVIIEPSQLTVPADGSRVGASIVNSRKLGGLNVTKVVNWNGVTPDELQSFEICIAGPSFAIGNCQAADYDGATLMWNGLIPGDYRVYEAPLSAEWLATVDTNAATVPTNGGSGTATITNTRKRGSLTVAKVVNWNGITPDPTKTFRICITGPSFPSGDCKKAGYTGSTLQWNNLIPGSYSVSESYPGPEWTVAISGSPATVPVNGVGAAVSVLNTRKLGSLIVTKLVDWNGVEPDRNKSFTVCIAGPTYTNGNCKSAGFNGGVLTWKGLMPGIYNVAENNPGRVWDTLIIGSPATVVANGDQTSAAVVNTRQPLARVTVTKVLTATEGNSVPDQWSFVLRITGAEARTVTESNATATWLNLEANRSYVLSEDDPASPWVEKGFTCTINGVAAGGVRGDNDFGLTLQPADHAICTKYNGLSNGTGLEPVGEPSGVFRMYLPAIGH